MPELPEVETFVRRLQTASGATITAAEVLDAKLRLDADELAGAEISSIERRGKNIVFDLGTTGHLVIHLRMSGRLRLERSDDEVPYTRLILRLDSGASIYFVNPRRLGTAILCRDRFGDALGVEPMSSAFTQDALAKLASASRAPIKHVLMDQRRIAGIGNIYAAESLWQAGIDPRRLANSLGESEFAALHGSLITVLSEAIDQLGTTLGSSVSDYRPSSEETGSFQNKLFVYGREGEDCSRCGTTIERTVQQGRSTCYCPSCQH
ncbi:MAG: bifunctional DNA-formamidopyrimidine glycosylase/DNA-(apurinic or apyrimidinic site) lyase [Candidatus Bipolaricaulia bacterium]